MKSIFRRLSSALLLSVSLFSLSATAAEPINTLEKKGLISGFESSGVAIRGYDTVAYFTQGKPVEGSTEFTTEWEGASWRFSSQEHLDLFTASPEDYAPQYGGYCAYGVAKDGLVKIEPENWSIIDDKLYLNFNDKVQGLWEADIAGFISAADRKFDALLKSE